MNGLLRESYIRASHDGTASTSSCRLLGVWILSLVECSPDGRDLRVCALAIASIRLLHVSHQVILRLAAESYQSIQRFIPTKDGQSGVAISTYRYNRSRAEDARLGSLADSDSRSVQVLLEPQVVLGESAELELAHRLFPGTVHHGCKGRMQ